jgi:antitoxin (DNA-binding transcriptional repressor) of toxin-antitoxin stability system
MKVMEIHKATSPLEQYARKVKKEPVILTENGKPVAALVALQNADMETVSMSTNPRFLALIARSRERRRSEGGVSSREVRKRLRSGAQHAEPVSGRRKI